LPGSQKGAYVPSGLLHSINAPPPVEVDASPDVVVGFESPCWVVVVAVKLAGAALIVVGMPFMVVSTGVIVAIGVPLASTETQGVRVKLVTEELLGFDFRKTE